MDRIVQLQHWLYAGAVNALNAMQHAGIADAPALLAAAFGFGMLHALLSGHGKAVLATYYAGSGGLAGALASSVLLIATHVGSAVLLVLSGVVVLQRTIGGAGRAPNLEHFSQGLIVAMGLWLLWRALRPHSHGAVGSTSALALVTGLVPCSLTTFIITYAATRGLVAQGLLLAAMFASGMIVTVAAFPIFAVLLRGGVTRVLERNERWRGRLGHGLEIASAVAIRALGLLQMAR